MDEGLSTPPGEQGIALGYPSGDDLPMPRQWNVKVFRAVLAWLCLSVHLTSLAWCPALFSAAIACLDDEHRVDLRWESGQTSVVLRHDAGLSDHLHCPVAAVLVSLSQPDDAAHPDHVLRFGSVPEELAPGRWRPSSPAFWPPLALPPAAFPAACRPVRTPASPVALSRPPPVPARSLHRSVELLI